MRTTIAIAVVALMACGPEASEPESRLPTDPPRFELVGDHLQYTGALLQVAEEHCGRPLSGRLEIVPEPLDPKYAGFCDCAGEDCQAMIAWVHVAPGFNGPAWMTHIAHEIGHWCLQTSNEDPVVIWAADVNSAAHDRSIP